MKKILLAYLAIVLLCSHDMFLKFDNFFLEPGSQAVLQLFNGTFDASENSIDRNRMLDVSLVGNGFRVVQDSTQWFERDLTTYLNFKTGESGTWVAGVSTAPRTFTMEAEKFNNYLEHDGVVDMLLSRKRENKLDQDATEKYSKHVKTIFQVGDKRSNDWATELGYPIEFIPLKNPYKLHAGDTMKVKLLLNSEALSNQMVLIGSEAKNEHSHDGGAPHTHEEEENGTSSHTHEGQLELRTDENGIIEFELSNAGIWHMRTIYMEEKTGGELTHESNWATLTFAIDKGHSHGATTHSHENTGHDPEFPSIIFWSVSLVIVILLFLYFRKRI
ncbi:MAG: DUF4198 domain-containing protein [Nonlabens sp.]